MAQRIYKNWITAYADYASFSEAPRRFHTWTGISMVAGALRRQVWIDQGYFQWTPNFYIIFVGPPGIIAKSTTASIGARLLRRLSGVHFGPETVTWQSLVQSMAQAREMVPMPDGLFHTMSCVTIITTELGTFLNPKDRDMVTVLTRLWDGQIDSFTKETKTQGNDEIINPWINIIGCTTPSWFAENVPVHMLHGGFLSRCVLIYGDRKDRLVAYPGDEIPADFTERGDDLVHDLEVISTIRGEYRLSESAKVWGRNWYEEHYERIRSEIMEESLQGYMARKQTHIHKLAIILAAAQRDARVIEREDLESADKMITPLEREMHRIFNTVGTTQMSQMANILLVAVRRYKKIPQEDLFRMVFHRMSFMEYKQALESAFASQLCKIVIEGPTAYVVLTQRGEVTDDPIARDAGTRK